MTKRWLLLVALFSAPSFNNDVDVRIPMPLKDKAQLWPNVC